MLSKRKCQTPEKRFPNSYHRCIIRYWYRIPRNRINVITEEKNIRNPDFSGFFFN